MRPPTRVEAIVERLSRMAAEGMLQPGDRVASVRQAAKDNAVSKNTMADAYDRLVALGVVEGRPGSGYYVTGRAQSPTVHPPAHLTEALDLVSLLREQLDQRHNVRPGDGRPPTSWMEDSELGTQFGRVKLPGDARGVEDGYGSPWGYLPLRERICVSLRERSIRCGPEQVLLTLGANHALDLITRHLIEPGDTVFVDDPGYYPLFGKLRLAKARIVGIRRGPDGPDLDDLNAKLAQERPKLFFTQSLAHNPTGGSLSLSVAHGLLQAAERHGFHIVEDDAFADLLSPVSPRLAALDQLQRVIYVGTFSKTLSASVRVGYLAASPALAAALCDIKLLTVVATSDHVERFVYGLIARGHYLRHLRRLRGRVEAATTKAIADLGGIGLAVTKPRDGGFYLWAELPPGTDETELCRQAARQGIFLAPGSVFAPDRRSVYPALRINVAHASHPDFLTFLKSAVGV
jgi:DNA-binding transcriptional MocR family regulator